MKAIDSARVKIREFLNPFLGRIRVRLHKIDPNFTIISNNCWGGHVYRYYNLPYQTPTIGLFFFSKDFVRFCHNLQYYLDSQLVFIKIDASKYCDELRARGYTNVPIARLKDIEVVFLHYKSEEEAREKWERRLLRINWNNVFFKMSEQNLCSQDDLKAFDELPTNKKIVFVTRDYGLDSQIVFKQYFGQREVKNDTLNFRKYINLSDYLRISE